MKFVELTGQAAGLTAAQWDLYAEAPEVARAAQEMSEGLVQAMGKPTVEQAWDHMELFMERFKNTGAADTEPRAVIQRFFDQVKWSESRADRAPWNGVAYVVVIGCASEDEDEGVQGVYPFEISPSLDVDPVARQDHATAVAKAVLDKFHDRQGIGCLDDFEIDVLLSDGTPIVEEDGPEPEIEVRAEYGGRMEETDAPAPVWHQFHLGQIRSASEMDGPSQRGS